MKTNPDVGETSNPTTDLSVAARKSADGQRLPELDSVRGLAALSVVFLHFHDMWLPMDASFLPRWKQIVLFALHPFYAGTEAVVLFFLLSGIVLSLPLLNGRRTPYPRYVVRRFLRIYGPYAVALFLAVLGDNFFHGKGHLRDISSRMWSERPDLKSIGQHLLFFGAYDVSRYNYVIWSLVHELRISLLFPLAFWLVRRLKTLGAIGYAIAASTLAASLSSRFSDPSLKYTMLQSLHYSGFFVAGIVVASHREMLADCWNRMSMGMRVLVVMGTVLTFSYSTRVLYSAIGLLQHRHLAQATVTEMIVAGWLTLFAALSLIVLAMNAAPFRTLLLTRPARFAGRISYSLYLVHAPVLFILVATPARRIPLLLQFPLYVALAVAAGWLFCRLVEEPFIRLSRRAG